MTISIPSKKRIVYGVSNFEEFRTSGGYFVDKTEYIKTLEEVRPVWKPLAIRYQVLVP